MPIRFLQKLTLAILFLSIRVAAYGQGIGVWQFHGAYSNIKTVAKAGNTIYVAGDYSAFTYDNATGELDDFTRLDGLSDNAYSQIAYNEPERTLVICYSTGNIDLVKDGLVQNLPALLDANILGSRAINQISFRGSLAYLSCDFGIVVLDLNRREIKSSNTNLDATTANSPVAVYAADATGDSLFLATSQGIKAINLNDNLMDSRLYKTWGNRSGLPNIGNRPSALFRYNNRTYVTYPDGFYYLKKDSTQVWEKDFDFYAVDRQKSVTVRGNALVACINNLLFWKKTPQTFGRIITHRLLVDPVQAAFGDNDSTFFVADRGTGLVKVTLGPDSVTAEAFRPDGPSIELPFTLSAKGKRLYMTGGGYETSAFGGLSILGGYSKYEDGFWSNYNRFNNNFPEQVTDVVSIFEGPTSMFITSFGFGILEKPLDQDSFRFYSDISGLPNTLVSAIPGDPTAAGKYIRITDIKTDSRGDRWVLNASSDLPLHRWTTDNEWTAYRVIPNNRAAGVELLVDQEDIKWMRMLPIRASAASIIAFREGNTTTEEGFITDDKGLGGLPNNAVYDYAFDKEGILWICTGAGLAALYTPSVVLSGEPFDVTLPIFDGRPLLENDLVTSIAIDGGGRKWVGTRSSGLWLFDKDVTRVLANYTFENSPLPSNGINDLAIVSETGQLFIATERGTVSLRIDATDVGDKTPNNNCVKIFPNPVRPDFSGIIGIECLPENAVVKITDQANRLVYETRANGSTATWNGKNYNGRKAAAGVYYVYAVTQGQRSGVVGKIAIVR